MRKRRPHRISSVSYTHLIAASHTDWPCMRIKPQPELVSGGCCRLSVEPYGGAILNTWLDRPLGLAGVALVRTDDPMRPARRLVAWDEPLAIIPNVAIHLNRCLLYTSGRFAPVAISGRQLRFRRRLSCDLVGYCEIATSLRSSQ